MTIIKCLSEKIEDELHDASDYVELAMKWKAEYPEVAELFYDLSGEEMEHMNKLHEAVQDLIEAYRKKKGRNSMKKAKITLHPDYIIGDISPRLFGAFLEPIGSMVNGSMFNPKHPAADSRKVDADDGNVFLQKFVHQAHGQLRMVMPVRIRSVSVFFDEPGAKADKHIRMNQRQIDIFRLNLPVFDR